MLSPRTERVLKSIVGQYIAKAKPVPSQSLADSYDLSVSPATIRNDMAHLEQEGYIFRPHTSAGSIPSDKGYRHYVESRSNVKLPASEQLFISHLFYQIEHDIREWLNLATTLISKMVQNVAVITVPKLADCQFKHLELVALQDSLALLVLILHGAKLKQQLITFDKALSQSQLTVIANKLNAAYSGLNRLQILDKNNRLSATEQPVSDCISKIMQAEDETDHEETCLDGWHFILNQPEFSGSNQIATLIWLAENRNLLKTIIPKKLNGQEIQVIIGKENKTEAIQNYSVVIKKYSLPNKATGTIVVIGPTRMPYIRTISSINYISSMLKELMVELYS